MVFFVVREGNINMVKEENVLGTFQVEEVNPEDGRVSKITIQTEDMRLTSAEGERSVEGKLAQLGEAGLLGPGRLLHTSDIHTWKRDTGLGKPKTYLEIDKIVLAAPRLPKCKLQMPRKLPSSAGITIVGYPGSSLLQEKEKKSYYEVTITKSNVDSGFVAVGWGHFRSMWEVWNGQRASYYLGYPCGKLPEELRTRDLRMNDECHGAQCGCCHRGRGGGR